MAGGAAIFVTRNRLHGCINRQKPEKCKTKPAQKSRTPFSEYENPPTDDNSDSILHVCGPYYQLFAECKQKIRPLVLLPLLKKIISLNRQGFDTFDGNLDRLDAAVFIEFHAVDTGDTVV